MTLTFLYFNKDSSLSDRFHKRKWWACLVYRAVLALASMLAAISLGMSSYAVYQVTMDEKGRTNINPFYKPHQVDGNKQYRMWNPVSMSNDGLLQLNPFDGNVYCNGSFSNSGSKFPSFFFCPIWRGYLEVKTVDWSQSATFRILSRSKRLL